MHKKLYLCTALLVGLVGVGTAFAVVLSNNSVQASVTPTARVSCCPDGACCPDGPCCPTATGTAAKKASCCPDGDCCPDGPCCGGIASKTPAK